jgi:ubiquinone/menaquinone biosynthesis C-methylase UbiE
MEDVIYNKIGIGYNDTRRADPYITQRIIANLQPTTEGLYLDIGCGTGNYLQALMDNGYTMYGVDPSDVMLEKAKEKCADATIVKAVVENLPFADQMFDGVVGNFTLHHWTDLQQGLSELYRVMKPGSHAVFLSFTPKQMFGYWLCHYFPKMMERSAALVPSEANMIVLLRDAGFSSVKTEKYFVQDDLQDHFLYSSKYKPSRYLDPEVRKGASSFSAFCEPDELETGLKQLETDIRSGVIHEIIEQYENEEGDYMFFNALK